MGLAFLVLENMAIQAADVEAFYTDEGFLPRYLAPGLSQGAASLYWLSGSLEWAVALQVLTALSALAMLVGYRTRWATILTFILIHSMQKRNPETVAVCEQTLRIALFYAMFLPLAHYWSWDSRGREKPKPEWLGAASVAWRIQWFVIYFFSGVSKATPFWWSGQGLDASLHCDMWARPFALWFAGHLEAWPSGYEFLGRIAIVWEIAAGFLLLAPCALVQFLTALALMAMHAIFSLCFQIDDFSLLCMAALLVFTPGFVWDRLARRWPAFVPGQGERPREHPVAAAVLVLAVVYVLQLNGSYFRWCSMPAGWRWFGRLVGLYQRWDVFSNDRVREGGWRVLAGRLRSGRWVDLYHPDQELSWSKPAYVCYSVPNNRHYLTLRRYIDTPNRRIFRESVARYLKTRWERRHPEPENQLVHIEFVYFAQLYEPGRGYQPAERLVRFSQDYTEEGPRPAAQEDNHDPQSFVRSLNKAPYERN